MFYGDLPVDYGVFHFFSLILWFWGGDREISIFVCPIKLLRFPVIRVGRHFIRRDSWTLMFILIIVSFLSQA